MQMTLTVYVPRRRPHPVDVVVEWSGRSTAAELCAALAEHLGEPVPGLSSCGRVLPGDAAIGMPPLVHGASVAVAVVAVDAAATARGVGKEPSAVLDLVVVGGPDAGRRRPLSPPGVVVGRATGAGLVVDDESLSRCHLFVGVGPGGVTVEDDGSTNGVTVDGVPVDTVTTIDATSTVVIGSTTLRLRRSGGPGPPVRHPGDGTVRVTPTAGAPQSSGDVEVQAPDAPPVRQRARVPWIAAAAPVPVAVALAFFLGPQLLLFAALGPVSLLAGALGDRWGSGRERRRELAAHADAVERAHHRLTDALRSEQERIDRAHPDPAAVLETAERRLRGLWSGGGTARVRLGLGDVPTRVVWVEGATRSRPTAPRAPLVVDLAELSCLGVVGSTTTTDGLLAGLVGQLCTANSPHELSVAVASSDPRWSWVGRLPHARQSSPSADTATSEPPPGGRAGDGGSRQVLVAPRTGPNTDGRVRAALAEGVVVLVAAPTRAELPAGCRALVHRVDGGWVLDAPGGPVGFVPDLVGRWWVERLSRALAPLRCADRGTAGGLPSRLTLAEALGVTEVTAALVDARWRDREVPTKGSPHSTWRPAAVVGVTPDEPFVIDLCRDGPHMLVGGTTGSGKSEFLRTLVTSLAVSTPPEELAFVLVDFKGGAAFGACAELPHVVGLVTDLDDHLVSRALASLRAELRRRERVLAAVGASDLDGYQRLRSADAEPLPRLVVVVDELRALVEELPEFVTGLVRLAALGRSLGVHLVLATQRPSGALGSEVQANVSLRIAFRMRDRADSVDVLDDGAAATIRPSTPGRALARGAEGSLVTFQAATVAAPSTGAGPGSGTGTGLRVRPVGGAEEDPDRFASPVDVAADEAARALVSAVREASRRRGMLPPRPPWMAPLPAVVTASAPGATATGHRRRVVGLVDEPDLQRVTSLDWAAADGSWLLAGGPGSGRTTAVRALALAAVHRSPPESLHLYVIDGHGSLADLAVLPHLGTSARVDDVRACAALVRHLRDEVDRRLAVPAPDRMTVASTPTVLVIVDGWDQLVEAHPAHGGDQLTDTLLRVLRDGRSVRVVGAVTGGRSLLHPRWGEIAGRTFLLGRIDPLDAALAGLRAADAPRDPPPGRAVRVHDRREAQFALVPPADTSVVAQGAAPRPSEGAAWRWVDLPAVVRRTEVPAGPGGVTPGDRHPFVDVLLGVGGENAASLSWRPGTDGRRMLVVGPPRSGRTNALRVITESLCATGRLVAVVCTPTDAVRMPWPAGSVVIGPGDTDALVRLRRHHRDLAVCVDDADRLTDDSSLPVLREIADLVDRDSGLVIVSTSSVALATRFSGIDVDVARHGCGLVLNPTVADRSVLSAPIPDDVPRLPGRGAFVTHGGAVEVQVLLAAASVGQVVPGKHLGLGVTSNPRRADGHEGHREHDPADGHPSALNQTDSDRQEDRVPDDGRGAGPRPGTDPSASQHAEPDRPDQDQNG